MTGVNPTGKGFVPYCMPCGYVGKPQRLESMAGAQVRQHEALAKHRMVMLGVARRERVAT